MKFYYFKTTAIADYKASDRRFPCGIGKKAVENLIQKVKKQKWDVSNWDDLKMMERTIWSIGKEAEMHLLVSESSYYGKRYLAIAY